MIYRARVPSPPLARAVRLLWHYEGYKPPHQLERVLPAGSVELIIRLQEADLRVHDAAQTDRWQSFRGPMLSGVQSRYTVINTAQQERIMGVHFAPGGAYTLFGLPADQYQDSHLTLESIWGSSAQEIWEQLVLARSADQSLAILERELARRFRPRFELHPQVRGALQEFHHHAEEVDISRAVENSGLSSRRFIELFRRHVGATPKVYRRIQRFQRALRVMQKQTWVDWSDFAVEGGYYDQSHLIRDFRQFSGLTPTMYFRLQREFLDPVPAEERGQICPIPLDAPLVASARENPHHYSHGQSRQPCAA